MNATFTVYHADHGISATEMQHIQDTLSTIEGLPDGFFIQHMRTSQPVPCGLYGPVMGDADITDDQVQMIKRSEDRPADRMIKAEMRMVRYVQVIGMRKGNEFTLYTVYGGPLAPRNPADTSLSIEAEKAEAREFWAVHALAY